MEKVIEVGDVVYWYRKNKVYGKVISIDRSTYEVRSNNKTYLIMKSELELYRKNNEADEKVDSGEQVRVLPQY